MRPGLHWPNSSQVELSARKRFELGRFFGAVVMTVVPPEEARWVATHTSGRVVYRIYEPAGDLAAPADVANRVAPWISSVDPGGCYQLLNEPDREYMQLSPERFAKWWDLCAGELLMRFPGLRLGFPAPSIDRGGGYLLRAWQASGLRWAAFIAERGYWQNAADAYSDRWGMRWKRSLALRLPVFVCEFGNTDPATTKVEKARQYLDYAASLPRAVQLAGAFIGAGGDPSWDSEASGRLWIDDAMAGAVGAGEGERQVSVEQVLQYRDQIVGAARKYELQPSIVAGLIDVESGGNPDATSPDNGPGLGHALGLMQVLEGEFSASQNGHDVAANLEAGCRILRAKMDAFGGRLESGLAAYFGAVDKDGNPTDATDLTGTSGKKYVALVEASAARFVELDAAGESVALADPDFKQYAPKSGTWREAAVNLKGIADDALVAGRGGRQLAQQIVDRWGTR